MQETGNANFSSHLQSEFCCRIISVRAGEAVLTQGCWAGAQHGGSCVRQGRGCWEDNSPSRSCDSISLVAATGKTSITCPVRLSINRTTGQPGVRFVREIGTPQRIWMEEIPLWSRFCCCLDSAALLSQLKRVSFLQPYSMENRSQK